MTPIEALVRLTYIRSIEMLVAAALLRIALDPRWRRR